MIDHILTTENLSKSFGDLQAVRGRVADILLESGVLLTFAFLFFAIGVRRFRYE